MNQKNRSKPLRKTVAYMHRMIYSGKWKTNSKIPTLERISSATGVSIGTVRKAVAELEYERLLDNNGSLGFCVIPPSITQLYEHNKQLYFVRMLNLNLDALEHIASGGKVLGKFIVNRTKDNLKVFNVVSGETVVTDEAELYESVTNPITLASLISLTGRTLHAKKNKYFKQQKLREIANIVLKKKEC